MIDETWVVSRTASATPSDPESVAVTRLWDLLRDRAEGFAELRPDVKSSRILIPRRGLQDDEAASFMRAVDAGIAVVDDAGFVTLPTVKQKRPAGRYALFSRSGEAISVNLEYLIQIGATAELILDHGWQADRIGFEQGEFDAVGYDQEGRVVLAMEAKARTTGADSLDKLVREWIRFAGDLDADLDNNAGRKWRELARLCADGPVTVLLVADGSRWTLEARPTDNHVQLTPGGSPRATEHEDRDEDDMLESIPYDPSFHRAGTVAGDGGCSWHGRTCGEPPVISFRDAQGDRQSGCERAVRELRARGELADPDA